jgi:hypothetical protein
MAALGGSPFEFTDANGRQVSVPLAALKFTSGVLSIDGSLWPPLAGYAPPLPAQITALLATLKTAAILSPPVVASPKPALVISAADKGVRGNNITVEIATTLAPDLDPSLATFDITIKETEVYEGLTTATIEGIVGTGATPGSKPGVAHLVEGSLDNTLLPKTQTPTFPAAADGVKATVDIVDDAAKKVFTLEAEKPGPNAKFASATISAVDDVAGTFTLTLSWQHKVTGAKLPSLDTDIAPLKDEISVSPPSSGVISVPASTTSPVALSGGSASAAATAVFFAGE